MKTNHSKNSGNLRYRANSANPNDESKRPVMKDNVKGSPRPKDRKAMKIMYRDLPNAVYRKPKLRLKRCSRASTDLICIPSNTNNSDAKKNIYTATNILPDLSTPFMETVEDAIK